MARPSLSSRIRKLGPCVISLWTHPDVGTGTFFVLVDPLPGSKIPDDLKFEIGVQPESGRLPEVVYAATREDNRGQAQYKALTEFDRDEFWRVRLVCTARKAAAKCCPEWKPRLRASDDGIFCCTFCRFWRSGSCGFGESRARGSRRNKKLQVRDATSRRRQMLD